MHPLVQKTIEIARANVGVVEGPKHDNSGPEVEKYLKSVGLGKGNPWCASFVYWCADQAATALNMPNPLLRTGACQALADWAKGRGILHDEPAPGAIFLRWENVKPAPRFAHTGFVEVCTVSTFDSIEGNTNLDGSRDGYGVFRRHHTVDPSLKYIWWESICAPADLTFKLYNKETFITDMPVIDGKSLCPLRVWAQMLGFTIGWDQAHQLVLFNNQPVHADVSIMSGVSYAPIRQLADAAGLVLDVDSAAKIVHVRKA